MHRKDLLSLLSRYPAADSREAECLARFRAFVERRADCFERELLEGHVTGSAWILDPSGTRALLTHHRKLDRWLQIGGHADGESDVLATALREAREESGIQEFVVVSPEIFDLDIHEIPARGEVPAHFHYDVRFALRAKTTDFERQESESKELRWVAIEEIEKLTDEESILRMVRKWRERYSTPP